MGYVKEPAGVDFLVDCTPLTPEDKKKISEVIAYYKATGKKMPIKRTRIKKRLTKSISKKTQAEPKA